jgi:two-component system cell cycle response regulator DivK
MPRVLMVDSAALFRMLEESFLRRAGWEIVCAPRGGALVDKARALLPDLVLLDTTARDCDAPVCLAALRSESRLSRMPVVVLADPAAATLCEAAGADATLAHPVEPAALESRLSALAQVSSRRGTRRPARLQALVETAAGVLRGRVKDISRTGVFLALPRPIPIESRVALRMRLPAPEGSGRVQAHGIVVRRVGEDLGSHLIAGIGVRFTAVDERSGRLIDRFVSPAPPAGGEGAREVIA